MTICLCIFLIKSLCLLSSGVETVCEVIDVEDLTSVGSQSVVSKLFTTESGNEEKPCVIDEIVLVSPSFYGSVGTEGEKMINESLEEVVLVEEVAKLDQEIGVEQRTEFLDIEPQEILNMEYGVVDDDDEVINEGKADPEISKPVSQESNMIQETGPEVNKEEKDMELGREASLKRMSRCRSLPVSRNSRLMGGDSLVQQLVSGVVFPSSNKMGLEKANKSGTVLVSCGGSNNAQETTEAITDSDKEARLEMRSPSFRSDLRDKERSGESTEITTLLCQDKTETYEAAIDVEEKTVMLKRTETEETRAFELSLGLSLKHNESSEAENSVNETKSLGDNFLDKKANSFETPIVSCMGSNITQETTEARIESHKEAVLEMRSPSFGHNHRIEEKSDESTEKTSLLSQDKTETYEATIDVEEKNIILKRSETEKTRGFELSLGLSMNPSERFEAGDSIKDSKGSEDNLPDKKASLGSMKGRARKRSKSSLLGTCLCCATVMN